MKPLRLSAAGFFVFAAAHLIARNPSDGFVSPFVSDLRTVTSGDSLVLLWRDAPDLPNAVYEIRRSADAFESGDPVGGERVATVSRGIRTFTDTPPGNGPWWYAILTVTEGQRIDVVIPWRNGLGTPVRLESAVRRSDDASRVLSLDVVPEPPYAVVSFRSDRSDRDLTLYRVAADVTAERIPGEAVAIGKRRALAGLIVDRPPSGRSWKYVVVDSAIFESADPDWTRYAAVSAPLFIPSAAGSTPDAKYTREPLPLLRIDSGGAADPIPPRRSLSELASERLALLPIDSPVKPWSAPAPQILDIDRMESSTPRQMDLRAILDDAFTDGRWEQADEYLFRLSSTGTIDDDMYARIQFYRGQCAYHENRMEDAFLAFNLSSDRYYRESRAWIARISSEIVPAIR